MSYILEALRKADAERERGRGAVPGLNAQAAALGPASEAVGTAHATPWLWLLVGAVLAFAAVLAWHFGGQDAPPPASAVPAPFAVAEPARTPAAPTVPIPLQAPEPVATAASAAEPVPVPIPERAAAPRTATLPAPGAGSQATRPRGTVAPPAEPKAPAKPAPAAATRLVAAPASAVKGAASGAAADRVPSLAELPEEVRRQMPAIGIGGSVYSSQPDNRLLIVNGQVYREGAAVAAGLLLEQIGPRSAVFSIRGQRFEVPL
jgi:general secretion pathway protein B